MKKLIFLIAILLFLPGLTEAQFFSKLSFGVKTGIGYDMQQNNPDYFPTRLIIPSSLGSSILRIQNPKRYGGDISYSLNDNMDIFVSYGQTIRGMKYWSLDTLGGRDNCLRCKFKLKIKQNDIFIGLKFRTNFNSKINFYFLPTIGNTWIKSSPRYGITKDNPQTEVFSLHDDRNWYMLHVLQDGSLADAGVLSLNFAIGGSYRIWKHLFLEMDFNFNNEINNGSELIIWDYDKEYEMKRHGYSPLLLNFKSLFTNIILRYRL